MNGPLSREDRLIIPNGSYVYAIFDLITYNTNKILTFKLWIGKYYLVDVGIMLRSGLIAPYGGVYYHLK